MSKEEKVVAEFVKLLTGLSKDTKESNKSNKQLLALTKDQLSAIRELAGNMEDSQDFRAVEIPKVFDSKASEDKFEREMIEKQEQLEKVLDDDLEAMQDDILEGNDIMAEMMAEMEDESKKQDKRHKESEKTTAGHFDSFKSSFVEAGKYLSELTGISSIVDAVSGLGSVVASSFEEQFGQLGSIFAKTVVGPLKGLGSALTGGIGSLMGLGAQESQESQRAEDVEMNDMMLETLANIDANTRKEDEMLKGGGFGDYFKKLKGFLPAGLFGKSSGGVGGKVGGMLSKMVGAGLILGGVVWMATDFIEGFKKGGMSAGFSQALLGKTDGSMKSAFANAGKWALIGAGIGTFVAPVVGTIAGGLIGASIGLLLNFVTSLAKTDESAGKKIGNFFLGGNGGVISSLFNGAKYASMGALIGTAFAPGIGTIAGGAIGFVIGFLVNFVKQILPDSIKEPLKKFGSWLSTSFSEGWDSMMNEFAWYGENIKKVFNFYVESYKKGFNLIGSYFSWVGNKIYAVAEYFGVNQYIDKASDMIKGAWTSIKDSFGKIVGWLSGIGEGLLDSFKTVMGDYKKSFFKWLGGGEDGQSKPEKNETKPVTKKGTPKLPFSEMGGGQSTPDITNKSEIKENQNSFVESSVTSAISNQTVANETPVINDNLVEGNSFSKSIAKNLKGIRDFIEKDLLIKLEEFLVTQVSDTLAGMRMIQQEQRMYDFATETGSLKGYASKTKEYAGELKKLERGTQEGYEGMKKAMTQVNNNQSNVTTNILTTGLEDTLRKK